MWIWNEKHAFILSWGVCNLVKKTRHPSINWTDDLRQHIPMWQIEWSHEYWRFLKSFFFVSFHSLYLKVYFIWYEYYDSCFLLVSVCVKYFFSSPSLLVCMCPLFWGGSLVDSIYIYGSYFCIHSASLCLLVGAFNPFTFKVIIDRYGSVAIYFVVWGSRLYNLSVFPV